MPGTANRRRQQAEYQGRYRARQKALRKPSRDDVARAAFHYVIVTAGQKPRATKHFLKFREAVAARRVELGFAQEAALARFDELVDRYEAGWQPQPKAHLDRTGES